MDALENLMTRRSIRAFTEEAVPREALEMCIRDRIGYHGFLTIEREIQTDPRADIQLAVDFLKSKMK